MTFPTHRPPDPAPKVDLGTHGCATPAALRAARHHPTAADLYDAVRRHHPHLGRATLSRALATLESAGLVVEVWRDTLGRHYDAPPDSHDHERSGSLISPV